jgi:hypothetical protein
MALMALSETLGLNIKMNFKQQEFKEVQDEYDSYSTKFKEIGELEDGDKLARDSSGVYYRHIKGEYFVQLRRWWTIQGRSHTFSHLDEDFSKFMKYLDKVLNMLSITYDTRYRVLGENLKDLANSLMAGLYTLKKTYPTEAKLICKIDSIILALIDFKTSIGEKLEIQMPVTQRRRTFSN